MSSSRSHSFSELISVFLEELDRMQFPKEELPSVSGIYQKQENDWKKITIQTNNVEAPKDTTGHSEILAIRKAENILQSRNLNNCILLTLLEPCLMCAGAIIGAKIGTLIYFSEQTRFPGISSYSPEMVYSLNHFPELIFQEDETIRKNLKEFFIDKR